MYKVSVYSPLIAVVGLTCSLSVYSAGLQSCSDFQCESRGLSSSLWQTVCGEGADARTRCDEQGLESAEPRGVLDGGTDQGPGRAVDAETANIKSIRLTSLKWAASRNTLMNSLKRFDELKTPLSAQVVTEDLRQLQSNIEALSSMQKRLGEQLHEAGLEALANQSWNQFSQVVIAAADELHIKKQKMLEQTQVESTALEIMDVEAELYEQAGYGYGKAGLYQEASNMWKKSAEMASELMALAENRGAKEAADQYRYQQSTRLHRAREHLSNIATP